MDDRADGVLLSRLKTSDGSAAFEELVRRHSRLVLGTCTRQLGDGQEAEDAAQAVFLVLWSKSSRLSGRASVAGWLHRVAVNVCCNARKAQAVRLRHEREAASMADKAGRQSDSELEGLELLDEELERLPEKYRLPILLCHLEGRSHAEVAALLQVREATVASRLHRGRAMLRDRLTRRGIVAGAGLLAAAVAASPAQAGVSDVFISNAVQAAEMFGTGGTVPVGLASAKTIALAKGTLHMTSFKIAQIAAAITAGVLFLGGGTALVRQNMGTSPSVASERSDKPEDWNKLQGTWQIVSVLDGGKVRVDREIAEEAKPRLEFDGDAFRLYQTEGKPTIDATFTLDPTAKPAEIQMTDKGGERTVRAIYRIEDNRLEICINEDPRGPSPTKFESKSGTSNDLLIVAENNFVPAATESEPEKSTTAAVDLARMQETWQVVAISHNGREAPGNAVAQATLVFDGDLMSLFAKPGKLEAAARLKLDPSENPHHIDLERTDIDSSELAIYRFVGDELQIVINEPSRRDNKRPTAFKSEAGTPNDLFIRARRER